MEDSHNFSDEPHHQFDSTAEVSVPQVDQADDDNDSDSDCNFNHDNDYASTKKRDCRHKLCFGLIAIVVVIGTAVGISLGILLNVTGTPQSNSTISDIIYSHGETEFSNPNSYQSRAKNWVLSHNFPIQDGSRMTIEQQVTQFYALACIYYSTFSVRNDWTDVHFGSNVTIPGWFSNRGWLNSPQDVCSNWHGLTCDDESGRITKIELDTNGLTGSFPPETSLLHETLSTIDLYNNMIHNVGDKGNSWLGELTNLEYLFFGTTSFEYDGIPSELGRLSNLIELDFSNSLYFGDISQAGQVFAKLSNLEYLAMEGNAYNSSLPSELVQLPELKYLYVGSSFLEGGIDFIPNMKSMYEIWLDDNPNLKGTISAEVGTLDQLASLSVSNCGLTGSIPTEMGLMTDMIQLWLSDNSLTGNIPSEFGDVVAMKILEVQNNELIGDMPSTICSRRRFGSLEELGADCDNAISCMAECCTCCGDECLI